MQISNVLIFCSFSYSLIQHFISYLFSQYIRIITSYFLDLDLTWKDVTSKSMRCTNQTQMLWYSKNMYKSVVCIEYTVCM